jgi:hypothetical protein
MFGHFDENLNADVKLQMVKEVSLCLTVISQEVYELKKIIYYLNGVVLAKSSFMDNTRRKIYSN